MPKTLPEKIIFTIIMAAIMVYGMIVYNVALATGGVTNATFGMALHEMPIMVPVAFVLEFFVVEKLATALAFTFMKPTGRPQFITIFYRLGIRTHNQISVHSGGYQNALTQNAGALKDYMVDQIAAGLIQQIVLSA